MSILKILPSAIDSTANYVFGGVISNGVDLGTAVAAAFSQANTSAGGDSFARQTANAAFDYANTAITTSGGTITGNLVVNEFTANTITANGVDIGTAVASAFLLANSANKTTTSDTAPVDPKVGDMWFDTITSITFRYTNDGTSNNWIDTTGPQNAGYIYQSYSLTPNTSTINETTGNTVIYTVASTNTADNTVLYWTNSGTTVAADFKDGVSNGTVTIINNSATITRSILTDETTETSETIILSLRTGSNTGPVVAISPTVTVGDTSQTPFSINYLLVAGGGPSGDYNGVPGGGGGAGGYLTGNTTSVLSGTPYTVTIGAGGTGTKTNGANTTFAGLTARGGGAGGDWVTYQYNGNNGGSGGGSYDSVSSGTVGQGFAGGIGSGNGTGAGGGAGAVGGNSGQYLTPASGVGGVGLQWYNGNYYAGGGSGGYKDAPGNSGALGGGAGNSYGSRGNGGTNTGGGGASATSSPDGIGFGGSGIAILRYLGTPVATGGTITQSGGYTYHTFTSSGTFTLS